MTAADPAEPPMLDVVVLGSAAGAGFPTMEFERARLPSRTVWREGCAIAFAGLTSGFGQRLYRPSLLPPVIEGDHVDYGWTGSPTPAVLKQRTW